MIYEGASFDNMSFIRHSLLSFSFPNTLTPLFGFVTLHQIVTF